MLSFFTKHPKSVCLTYSSHLKLSMLLSSKFAIASLKSFIHAIFPYFFTKSSTDAITEINEILIVNKCK